MTETSSSPEQSPLTDSVESDDPRYGLAVVVGSLHPLIEGALDQLDNPTPCEEFSVRQLLDHIVDVMKRVDAVGDGRHWSTVEMQSYSGSWGEMFAEAAKATRFSWDDPAKLAKTFEVPWGSFPGAPILYTYTGELAVHAWDLAVATGQEYSIDDDVLGGALFSYKMVPAEGREDPDLPFGPVVEVGDDASVLEQLAGWAGRDVPAYR